MTPDDHPDHVLRLHAERVAVRRQRRTLGVVRVKTETTTREQHVSEDVDVEHVDVTHVPIGRPVAACPPVRIDGDTTILSVVEEVLVVTRQLVLKEEVHIRKTRLTRSHNETVVLREQRAVVSRDPST